MKKDNLKFIHIFFVYLFLTIITVIIHNLLVDTPALSARQSFHQEIIQGKGPLPNQYRILPHLLGEGLIRSGFSFLAAFLLLRGLFTFLGVLLFHFYLRKWFKEEVCLIAGLFLLASLPLTYLGYFMQPADYINFVVFILGYWLIRERRDKFLLPLLVVGILNKEIAVLLILVFLFYRYDELKLPDLLLRLGGYSLVVVGSYLGVRKYFGERPFYCDFYCFQKNFNDPRAYYYPILLFSIFLFVAVKNWQQKPKFLKRAALMIPFFVFIHWTIAIVSEIRLFLPLFPIIIPLGLHYLYPSSNPETVAIFVPNILTRIKPYLLYIFIGIAFLVLFVNFCQQTQKIYLLQQKYGATNIAIK